MFVIVFWQNKSINHKSKNFFQIKRFDWVRGTVPTSTVQKQTQSQLGSHAGFSYMFSLAFSLVHLVAGIVLVATDQCNCFGMVEIFSSGLEFIHTFNLTHRFHVTVRLFSNTSWMTPKCGKTKKNET